MAKTDRIGDLNASPTPKDPMAPDLTGAAASDGGHAHDGLTEPAGQNGEAMAAAEDAELPPLEPMSWSLLGRLFGIPLAIVAVIVCTAAGVVLLFGSLASPQQRKIEDLLASIEQHTGERTMALLAPQEKQLWQNAVELSQRLEHKDRELTPDELQTVTRRLSAIVLDGLRTADLIALPQGRERDDQLAVRSRRMEFLLRALARTEQPEAADTLLKVVLSGHELYAMVAVQQLADMPVRRRESAEAVAKLLRRPLSADTRIVACTALSVLASPGDSEAVEVLAEVRLADDQDVMWAACLALARLGSTKGKATVLDLLDRSFLESGERYRVRDASGVVRRYPMPPERVNQILIAAMEAAAGLDDADIRKAIHALKQDKTLSVRGRALELVGQQSD